MAEKTSERMAWTARLEQLLKRRVTEVDWSWFDQQRSAVVSDHAIEPLLIAYSLVSRKLGRVPQLDDGEQRLVYTVDSDIVLGGLNR